MTATVTKNSDLYSISTRIFREIIGSSPRLSSKVLQVLAAEVRSARLLMCPALFSRKSELSPLSCPTQDHRFGIWSRPSWTKANQATTLFGIQDSAFGFMPADQRHSRCDQPSGFHRLTAGHELLSWSQQRFERINRARILLRLQRLASVVSAFAQASTALP